MAYVQVRDVLHIVRSFHEALRKGYQDLLEDSDNQRLKLLLAYLRDHEKALSSVMEAYEADISEGTLKTWFRNAPKLEPAELKTIFASEPEWSLDLAVKTAADSHDKLITWYKNLHEQADLNSIREILDGLIQLEHSESMRAVRDTQYLADL